MGKFCKGGGAQLWGDRFNSLTKRILFSQKELLYGFEMLHGLLTHKQNNISGEEQLAIDRTRRTSFAAELGSVAVLGMGGGIISVDY